MEEKKQGRREKFTPESTGEGRPQPHNLEVERAVLSSMLRDPDVGVNVAVEILGSADAFYSHVHRIIFSAICAIHNSDDRKVDLVTLANELKRNNSLDTVGGVEFLAELYDAVPTTVRMESWCNIVREYATLRRMINVCSESLAKCYQPQSNIGELIDQIESDIYEVRSSELKSSVVEIQDMLEKEFNALKDILEKKVEVGIKTGYNQLDEYTGGLKKGEMFVLAARPSIGKTSIALNIIRNIALNKVHSRTVAFFSLEMTAEQITRRLLCTEAKVAESAFWNNTFSQNDMPRLTEAASKFMDARILIDPTGGISIAELRAKARLMKMRDKIDLIVIDYLQLMHGSNRENRQQEVAEISGGIKALAKELKIPILVLAQLNREVDKTAGASSKPKLSHLRESGAIEQDADVVVFLHRNRDDTKDKGGTVPTKAWLIIEKNRNGRTGEMELAFRSEWMEFVLPSPISPVEAPPSMVKHQER